jgi:3-dehydroquinate synthase
LESLNSLVFSLGVRVTTHNHDVLVGSRLLDRAGELTRKRLPRQRCTIISDANVASHFGDRLKKNLIASEFEPELITISAGEKMKSLEQAGVICEQMTAAGLDRQSFVVGLGGGMIGDVSGFVAAIFHRGIPHVQIPTTLLAMVDSSIGGKTAVNTRDGKNLIGAIHHPALVIDDVDVLKTLPARELRQGFAEIIKHAIIADAEMFAQLQNVDPDAIDLVPLIERNVAIKSRIVTRDERDETGERALLNFGHTIGHAIERADDYRELRHGEAISLGMVAASAISMKRAGLPREQRNAIVDLLRKFELPLRLPANFPRERIFDALKFDKKFERGEIRFVVASQVGAAYLSSDVTLEDVRVAVDAL